MSISLVTHLGGGGGEMVGAWFSYPHEVQCVMGEDKQVVGRGWVCVGADERERR